MTHSIQLHRLAEHCHVIGWMRSTRPATNVAVQVAGFAINLDMRQMSACEELRSGTDRGARNPGGHAD